MTEDQQREIAAGSKGINSFDPHEYYSHLSKAEKLLAAAGDPERSATYGLVAEVCGFTFSPKEKYPFSPMWVIGGRRSMLPDDLNDDQLDQLATFSDIDIPSAIEARFCDVLWLRRRDHNRARQAVAAYIECAEKGIKEHWPNARDSALRAIKIANELGRTAPEREQVTQKLLKLLREALASTDPAQSPHWIGAVAEVILSECGKPDFIEIADALLATAAKLSDAWTAETYFELAAEAYGKAGQPDKQKEALRRIGETWESNAESLREIGEAGEGMRIAVWLEKAIDAYRRAGERDKAEQLLVSLQEANKLTIAQMKPIRLKIDITKYMHGVEKAMDQKLGTAAIIAFACLHKPTDSAKALETASREAQAPHFHKIFGSTTLAAEGNIVARSEGGLTGSAADVIKELVQSYSMIHSTTSPIFQYAREIMLKDQTRAWVPAVSELVKGSTFCEENRHEILIKAIIAGLDGDLLSFVHLAIPQIEHSIRILVAQKGGKTTSLRDGLMKERDLNQLLTERDAGKDASAALGEDLVWELRALLTEHSGSNLRNRICHGLASQAECSGPAAIYLLWLLLAMLLQFRSE